MLLKRIVGPLAVALVLLMGLVGVAQAKQFAMSGKWVQRRGVAYIPAQPQQYGVPAISGAVVSVQPAGTMTVPANQFGGTFSVNWPLPQPSLVQMSSHFTNNAPKSTGTMKAGHWTATRAFANFNWCPGFTGNPACASPNQGTGHGLIKYTAGPNQYGGTMQMLSGGGGTISFQISAAGPTIAHNPFGGATGAAPTEGPGGPYANSTLDDVLPAGVVTVGAAFSAYGLITVPGVPVGYGTTATWDIFGFPWTTGVVQVQGTQAGPYTTTTATLTGSKSLTANGAGNITLVAGGLANAQHATTTYMMFDYVQMTLTDPAATPSMSPAGIAVGALLMVLAVGYGLRRRF